MRTNSADYGHGGAYVRKREVRALARLCAPMAFIAAFLAVLFVPTIALADSSVIWGPSLLPNEDIGIVVNAPDRYRAAAIALGRSDAEIASWSAEVLAKLSNESTGGAFYSFAQRFGEIDDAVGSDNPLTAVVSAVGNSFWAIAETIYGNEIWLASYDAASFQSAASALATILAGGDIGGGGSDDEEGYFIYDFKSKSSYFTDVDKLYVPYDAFTYTGGWGGNYPSSGYLGFSSVTATTLGYTSFGLFDDASATYTLSDDLSYYSRFYVTNAHGFHGNTGTVTFTVEQQGNKLYVRRVSTQTKIYFDNYGTNDWAIIGSSGKASAVFNGSTSGGGNPVVPPTNWPDEPSAPSPPELPEPGTNPTVTPTPWSPVISPTFDFDLNITTEPTSNDLIDWVKKIYYELRNFHSDAQDWFDEVGKGIDSLVDAIDDAQEQIYGELQTIDDTLRDEGQKLRDYIYDMFHWLKDQLNFQNDTFNDNNIVYWLKRIWSKLGNGDVNVRPTDPTVDPPAWWEWLNRMLDSLLDGLVGVFNELLGGTGDLLEEVIHQFPFSIPWDIAAFLTALAAPPVTPVFDIVIPAVDGWWSQFTFHIDMSPYDNAAATVRLMTKLVFAGLLAWKSRELLDMMDVTKW